MHQDLHVESGVEAISGKPRLERASSLTLDATPLWSRQLATQTGHLEVAIAIVRLGDEARH